MKTDPKQKEDIIRIGKAVCETKGWVDARDILIALTGERITVREKQLSLSRISSILMHSREFVPKSEKHGRRTVYTLRRNSTK